jgi:O-antigen/teichoic acid export membrane protein
VARRAPDRTAGAQDGPPAGSGPASDVPATTAAATTSESVLRGGAWNTLAQVLPQVYTVVVSVVAARYLGPDGMGQQSFIAFAQLSVVMLFTGGLPVALMRFLGEAVGAGRPGAVRTVLRWAWGLEAAGALLGAAVLVAVGLAREDLRSAWLFAAAACALTVMHTVPSAALIGLQRWRPLSLVGITTGLLSVVATIAVLAAGYGIVGMFAVEAVISLANLLWATVLARRALAAAAPEPEPADDLKRRILPYAGWVSVDVLLTFVVWRRSEFFFLEAYSTDAEIAFYSIAFGAVAALLKLTALAAGVAAPAVATLHGAGDTARIVSGYGRAFRLTTQITVPATALALALGPLVLLLAYGEEYRAAQPVLLVLVLTVPVTTLANVAGAFLSGLGLVKKPLLWTFVATVVNVVAAFLLVPGGGADGAAVADLLAQTTASLPLLVLLHRLLGGGVAYDVGGLLRGLLASALAAAAAVAAVRGESWTDLVAGLAAAGVVLLAAVVVLRPLQAGDADWLAGVLGRRSPALGRLVRRCGAAP